jgi:Tfp pilus assembly protein PilN
MSNPFASKVNQGGSFLPEDYVARKAETRANIITLSLFALVMAGVTGAFVVTTRTWHGLRQQQQALRAEYEVEAKKIDQLKALEAKRMEVLEKAELTAALAERVPRWALLAELTLRMPTEMRRDMLTFKGKRVTAAAAAAAPAAGGATRSLMGNAAKGAKPGAPAPKPKPVPPQFEYQLTMAGTANSNNEIADYIAALRESPVLKDVELQFIREGKEDDKIVRKFELLAMVRNDVDSKALGDSLTALVAAREAAKAAEPAPTPEADKKQPLIKPAAPRPAQPSNLSDAAATDTAQAPAPAPAPEATPAPAPTPVPESTPVADPTTPTTPEPHQEAQPNQPQDPTQPQ